MVPACLLQKYMIFAQINEWSNNNIKKYKSMTAL